MLKSLNAAFLRFVNAYVRSTISPWKMEISSKSKLGQMRSGLQKPMNVISTFYRISRSCNSWTNIVDAVSNMKNELLSLKYPLRVLLRAAGRMATTDARWASIEGAWRADSRR